VDSAREQAVDSAALADLSSMIEIPKGVDAKSHRRSPALDRDDASRRQKALGRVQFTVALLHIAIRRYVMPGVIADVSLALQQLLHRDVRLQLEGDALLDPNVARQSQCYTEPVCVVLKHHERTLRLLFGGLCGRREILTLPAWMAFLRTFELIDDDLSERNGARCFCWSRMAVIDGTTPRGILKETTLPFEGFMEALVRVSVLKALPTDDEIDMSGCDPPNARCFLSSLRLKGPEEFRQFAERRASAWGHPAKLPPTADRVASLIMILISTVEDASSGAGVGDAKLSGREWKAFVESGMARRLNAVR